jgi:L-amino acid N-acyltransferase YncA
LLRAEARLAAHRGVRQLELWVFEDNCEAYRAYEQLGFRHVLTEPAQRLADRWERKLRLLIE